MTFHEKLEAKPELMNELLDLFERYHTRARNPRIFGKPFFSDAEREEALRGMIVEWAKRVEARTNKQGDIA